MWLWNSLELNLIEISGMLQAKKIYEYPAISNSELSKRLTRAWANAFADILASLTAED